MDIVYAYSYLAILGILAIGFAAMIFYSVLLYFRGRKMGVNKIRRPDGRVEGHIRDEEEMDHDFVLDPEYACLSCNIFHH
ncbi:MAG: hypothetical protein HWN68_01630 [Desulfobacterales bacterium]|nr:hypothetical protein [Desulfobacterales bacterium]